VLDLQARATAEQAMLTNDQSKLQTLYQAAQAQQWVLQQRLEERAIADVGSLRLRAPLGL
jgi:type IV secretion system protein VirB5